MSTDYTRPLKLAGAAAERDPISLREALEKTFVHISCEPGLLPLAQTLTVVVANLRRLPVQISLDPGGPGSRLDAGLLESVIATTAGIDPGRPIRLGPPVADALHVHIGAHPASTAACAAVPDGHGVRLRHHGHPFPRLKSAGTGLGAVYAAAILTGEIFKTITGLRPGTYQTRPVLDFCPVLPGADPGICTAALPELADTVLTGCGAIGTAIALTLSLLSAEGTLTVVDPQVFEDPNVATYSLGAIEDAARRLPKVDLVARYLPGVDVVPVHGTIQNYIDGIDNNGLPWPRLALGALDSIEARHDLQRLHADLVLDGSTGGPAGTTLALHEALPFGPCLRCYYPHRNPTGPIAEQRLHRATGLPMQRIARGDEPLTVHDLDGLLPEQRDRLTPHLGERVCGLSTIPELTDYKASDFRPSASFVAQQAASLVVGAHIARANGLIAAPVRRIEYDARFGPRTKTEMTDFRRPNGDCTCQSEGSLIVRIRQARSS